MIGLKITYFPFEGNVQESIDSKEPLLALISFSGSEMIVSQIDEVMEHHILLAKVGRKSTDIDKYFRIIVDDEGADWTFVCPPDYKGILNKPKRISEFYKDGFRVITKALEELKIPVEINIPKRYRRHLDMLGE